MVNENSERLVLHCPNIVALCLDSYNSKQQNGRLYHQYIDSPVRFSSLLEAFARMDKFYDDIQFPYASTKLRSFFQNRKAGGRRIREDEETLMMPEYERKDRKVMESFDNVIENRGTDATFIIRVQHRQHSSWQGEVTWVDEKKKEYFRSALELVRLIDGALNDSEGKTL